jgi:rhodanese-related sulfurtransferase
MSNIIEISIEDLKNHQEEYILVDVREPHELTGPEGQIKGVIRATLGSELATFLESADPAQKYVFICRSGGRSAQACQIAQSYGVRQAYNLRGGMMAWNKIIPPNNQNF